MKIRSTTKITTAAAVLAALVATAAPATAGTPDATALARLAASAPARESGPKTFASLSDANLWERIEKSGNKAVVGLKAREHRRGVWKGTVLASRAHRADAKGALLAVPGVTLVSADSLLPVVTVKIDSVAALRSVRSLRSVDYIEPLTFAGRVHSDSGAGCYNSDQYTRGGEAYSSTTPISKLPDGDGVPWNFDRHRLRDAWTLRRAAGGGTTLGVVDTGTFVEQRQLQSAGFAGGASAGRWVQHFSTTTEPSLQDKCNHGTRMAGTMAAPRDGKSLVGVAYKANLVTVKAHHDVWLNHWNVEQVAQGVRRAADAGAKVIALAFGDAYDHPRLADEIRAQIAMRDVLFVAAAGTDACMFGVVFPARMPEVVAATGLDPKGTGVHHTACKGPEVDIAAYIDDVPALGRYEWDVPITFGGSSDATAVISGIAGLIRGQHPTWNAGQVKNRLYQSAGSYRHHEYGYGAIDAYRATGGYTGLSISGAGQVMPGTQYTLTARPVGDGPFSYRWSNGATTQSIRPTAGADGTSQTYSVTVTDLTESRSRTASRTVYSVHEEPEPIEPPCTNYRYCP